MAVATSRRHEVSISLRVPCSFIRLTIQASVFQSFWILGFSMLWVFHGSFSGSCKGYCGVCSLRFQD